MRLALGSANARRLAAGVGLALAAMLLTHPLAVVACLGLAVVLAHRVGLADRSPALGLAAATIGLAVLAFNAAFAWRGASAVWEAPFRITLLGRPRLTLEALAWGATAGGQLAATVLALGAGTVAVPPEALNRAMEKIGLPASLARAGGLALRLVPDTTRDAEAMRDALRVRGVDTSTVTGASRTLVPLAARSLDRAQVAEEALLVRGYDPERTDTSWPLAGWLALLAGLVAALVAFLGAGRPSFYPTIAVGFAPPTLAQLALALAIPTVLVQGVLRCSS
jgi:energy-coupling factor transporter transmembrane protein EcfT